MTTREERILAKMAQIRAEQEEKAIKKEARYRLRQEREDAIKKETLKRMAKSMKAALKESNKSYSAPRQDWSWCNDGSVTYWNYKGMPYYINFNNEVWDSSHIWVGKYDPEFDKLDVTASEPVYDEEENC
jgi:hypothetical protein